MLQQDCLHFAIQIISNERHNMTEYNPERPHYTMKPTALDVFNAVQQSVNKLTPLLNVDQHCVQMWFKFVLNQFQAEDSDGT